MAIIETLSQIPGERYSFTVNTAALEVSITSNPALVPYLRSASSPTIGNKRKWFNRNDNVQVLSAMVILPYYFILSTNPAILFLAWIDETANLYPILGPGLSLSDGGFTVPVENYETQINVFAPFPTAAITRCAIVAVMSQASYTPLDTRISMIGVPAILNTTVQNPIVFVKVLHTLPMSDDP